MCGGGRGGLRSYVFRHREWDDSHDRTVRKVSIFIQVNKTKIK
jgi:hypothetical protein